MSYAGFYINLDHRPDRRAEMEAELARHGLSGNYQRFSAINGNDLGFANPHLKPGEMGCFSSHYSLLQKHGDGRHHLHIVEDDVIFASSARAVIDGIIGQDLFAGCDIVYTDVFVPIQTAAYKAYKQYYDSAVTREGDKAVAHSYSVIDLKDLPFASTTSYIVRKDAAPKLRDLYAREIKNSPPQPADLFIRRLSMQGELKVGCIFPFVTSVRLDHILETDIGRDYHQRSALAAHLARYSFFIDADLAKCEEYVGRFLPLQEPSKHGKILNHLLLFSQSDAYKSF